MARRRALAVLLGLCAGLSACQGSQVGPARRGTDPAGAPPDAEAAEDESAEVEGPIAPSHEPIVIPNPGWRGGAAGGDERAARRVAGEEGWEEKWLLASRLASGGLDADALAVIDAALAANPPATWGDRLRGLRTTIRMRQAEETLRLEARGVKDYVRFGADVDWVVRIRNVSREPVVFAASGDAAAPDGAALSASALVLSIVRRDLDIYSSELRRTWTQTVLLQRPGEGAVHIPPGGVHEVRARIPAAEAGEPIAGLRVFELEGALRPSGMSAAGRDAAEPLRIRRGTVVALPDNFEPMVADPVASMDQAVSVVAPIHLLVAGEFVPRDLSVRAMEAIARGLAEGDPALRTAALGALGRLRERSVGAPVRPLAAPLVAALEVHPERGEALVEALRALTGRAGTNDPVLWLDWWRREQASEAVVPAHDRRARHVIRSEPLRGLLAPLARTVEAVVPEEELLRKLRRGKPLRCKLGIDPTATTVHVGNGIPLWNLRRLQDLGHQAVLILGDYTATVGDPSEKDKTRPMLTLAQVEANLATWLEQIGKILDLSRAEVRRNSEWFSKMTFLEVLELSNRMTVQQMMERDAFQKRWKAEGPISVREFLYCLMQGWDSVMVRADVELGGTDQTFNLNVGRRLMEQMGMEPQVSLISPLLEGTDGSAKMSKSLGNCIGLADAPKDVFGMAMRIPDALLPKYLSLATDLPDPEIAALLAGPPMQAKLRMAQALVARYHGAPAGTREREEFVRVFSKRDLPTDIPDVRVPPAGDDGRWWIVDLLKTSGFATSTGEARRLIEGGGVHLGEATISDWRARVDVAGGEVLRVGRRRHARLVR